jgi:CDP-diacylglycerol--glycerol-3-phosphate 3-phosphatidyltransferase
MIQKLPNILSSLRIILAFLFVYLYLQTELEYRITSLVIFFFAAISDYYDGKIAREYEIETKFGVFLDPLADKFLTFAGFASLAVLAPSVFPWWIVIVITVRDVGVTLLRIYAEKKDYNMETRFLAKAKTLVQMIYLYLALLFGMIVNLSYNWVDILGITFHVAFWMVMLLTVYSGLEYIFTNKKLFQKSSA